MLDSFWKTIFDNESSIEPSLSNIKKILKLLGNPEKDFKSIHITGTNGKTSVAFLTSKLLQEQGLKVGTFTSPHLIDPLERITINGQKVSLDEIKNIYKIIKEFNIKLSFFEIMCVFAFYFFSVEAVDVTVIEVGMGGIWDATNVIDSNISVITNVALDHQNYLGDDSMDIAKEKSGIVKKNNTVILGHNAKTIEDFIADKNVNLLVEGEDFSIEDSKIALGGTQNSYRTNRGTYENIPLKLFGEHQVHNSLLAIIAAQEFLDRELSDDIIGRAFSAVLIPGRMELISKNPSLFIDAAHNPNGISELTKTVLANFGKKLVVIFSCFLDKDAYEMLNEIVPICQKLLLVESSSKRSYKTDDLYDIATEFFNKNDILVSKSVQKAVKEGKAISNAHKNLEIIATGSIYFIGEVKESILVSKNKKD